MWQVRRVVKTVQEVKVMLDRMSSPPTDPSDLVDSLPEGTIPHHFFCPITQDVMHDPVKTVDGMTYDRPAIERWLTTNATSPLTNMPLASKNLVPHTTLREQIADFIKTHQHLITPQSSSNNLLAGAAASSSAETVAAAAAQLSLSHTA